MYPDGGTDPAHENLRQMVAWPGFNEQRVHFIDLYAYGAGFESGAAELAEYNAGAVMHVLHHGGRPQVAIDVAHHLVGPVQWNRVVFVCWPSLAVFFDLRLEPEYLEAQTSRVNSAEVYGNLITVARADKG